MPIPLHGSYIQVYERSFNEVLKHDLHNTKEIYFYSPLKALNYSSIRIYPLGVRLLIA